MYTSLYAIGRGDVLRILRDTFPDTDTRAVHLKHVGLLDVANLFDLLAGVPEQGLFLRQAKTSLLSLIWTRFEAPIMTVPAPSADRLADVVAHGIPRLAEAWRALEPFPSDFISPEEAAEMLSALCGLAVKARAAGQRLAIHTA